MQNANHKALMQVTNVNLLNIRGIEISYFSVFFGNFATQSGFLAMCIIQSISQLPAFIFLTKDPVYLQRTDNIHGIQYGNILLEVVVFLCKNWSFEISITLGLNYYRREYSVLADGIFGVFSLTGVITFSFSLYILTNTISISMFGQVLLKTHLLFLLYEIIEFICYNRVSHWGVL